MRDDVDELLELTTNPVDRLWRYPIGRWALRFVMDTPITPHHITALHGAIGAATGFVIAEGTPRAWFLAGVMYEVRSILDCFDGVVARAKKLSSPRGRALDETADTVGFVSLMGGTTVCLARAHGWATALAVALLCTVISASCTTAWDFFKRRYTSLLREGRDTTEDELLALWRDYDERPGPSLAMAKLVATWQWLTLSPGAYFRLRARAARGLPAVSDVQEVPTPAARWLREAAARRDPELRSTLLRVGFVAGDNVLFILTVGLLLGQLLNVLPLAMAYGVVLWTVTVVAANRTLHEATGRTDAPTH
jgi:phosphatidylglycerophosphate synthase